MVGFKVEIVECPNDKARFKTNTKLDTVTYRKWHNARTDDNNKDNPSKPPDAYIVREWHVLRKDGRRRKRRMVMKIRGECDAIFAKHRLVK